MTDELTGRRGLNSRQILRYAKDNGYDSVLFSINKNGEYVTSGKFLDAYYEFVQIPVLGSGFVRVSDIEEQLGYDITFDVIDTEEEYKAKVRFDFIIREKELPEEWQFDEEATNV